MITTEIILMSIFSGFSGLMWWNIKRYITKVEDLETRVTKVETVLEVLGDIRKDLGGIKTDVEVIKSKLSSHK